MTSHIATLESRLGKQMFVRRRGGAPLLSSNGAALLTQARTFLAEGEKIRAIRACSWPSRVKPPRTMSCDGGSKSARVRYPAPRRRSITEIAFSWGFNSSAHFARAFKTRFGVRPRDFRPGVLGRA